MKCLAVNENGKNCARQAEEGDKYCWQHKGYHSKSKRSGSRSRSKSRSRSRSKSRSKSRSRSRSRSKSRTSPKPTCRELLSEKIRANMKEYKEGKNFYSPRQAIAVAYKQVKEMSPACKRVLSKPKKK